MNLVVWHRRKKRLFSFLLGLFLSSQLVVSAEVVFNDQSSVAEELRLPIYEWKEPDVQTKAVIVAIHGATLHGRVFDPLARHLASQGFLVVAFDLRGFGSWRQDPHKFGGDKSVHYTLSMHDVVAVLNKLKQIHPYLPLYCLGESLGANISFWVASEHSDLVDGIIVSSPCIKRFVHPRPGLLFDFAKGLLNPYKEYSLKPHIKPYLSDDKRVTRAYLDDPLIRKKLNAVELIKSVKTNENTLAKVEKIPENLPVLVIAGERDRIYDVRALPQLLKRVGSKNQTVHIGEQKGHLLLETAFIDANILGAIDDWLNHKQSDKDKAVSNANGVTESEQKILPASATATPADSLVNPRQTKQLPD